MRHLKGISRVPARAQTSTGGDVCSSITNDYQAQLCFLFQVLTSFFLPVFQLKVSTNPNA